MDRLKVAETRCGRIIETWVSGHITHDVSANILIQTTMWNCQICLTSPMGR